MVCKCICSFVVQSAFLFSLFALALLLIPNVPPYASFRESYDAPKFRPAEGPLALNERLEGLELWHEGEIQAPEAYAAWNGEIYTGLITGDVVKLTGQHITPVVKTGRPCRGRFEERICGRPLGLQFDKQGALYVADAYYGILKVDVKTGRKEVIVSPETKIEGKQPKIFNALAVASNGDIYWSDSSTNFYLDDGVFDSLADASGRLIHYNAKTKQNKVLIDKLRFANGVALSEDESEVLITETFALRVQRYYLKGPKAGTHDVFVDRLPGYPDNLNLDGKGGYLLPLIIPADEEHPQMLSVFAPFPLIRKFLARLLGVTEMIFEMIDRAYPNDYCLRAIHFIGHFGSSGFLTSKHRSTIVQVSKTGQILDSVHTTRPLSISEAFILKDTLYTGSPFENFVGRIKLSELGWEHLAQVQPKKQTEQPKPATTTTSKPTTTTTPKPTTTTTPKPTTTTTPKPTTQKQTPPPTKPSTVPPTTTPKPQATTPPPPVQKEARQAPQQQAPPPKQQLKPSTPTQVPPKQDPKPSTPPPAPKPAQTPPKQDPPPQVKPSTPPVQKPTQAPPKQDPKPSTPPPTPKPVQTPPKEDPKPQVKPSSPPVEKPTQAPPKPNQAPPKPTEAPPKPAEAPPKPTQAPPKPSQAPPKPTEAPPKPTQAPPKPSQAPPKPTQAPPKEQTKTVPVKETVKTR